MKARPILFSGAMVRALLAGTKTQTRRVVKGVPSWDHYGRDIMDWGLSGIHQAEDDLVGTDRWALDVQTDVDAHSRRVIRCPYGAPGDLLYVREAWRVEERCDDIAPRDLVHDWPVDYQAGVWSDLRKEVVRIAGTTASGGKLRPGIHQPRWASRLTLKVTEVRVERLQDISEADADAECFGGGFPETVLPEVFPPREGGWGHLSIPECYGRLWEHINGVGSWDANPWVWAVSFEVLRQNVETALQSNAAAPAAHSPVIDGESSRDHPLPPSETNPHG